MNKKLLSELDGTITNIFVPEKFGQYGYVLEDQVNIICLEIETKEGKIKRLTIILGVLFLVFTIILGILYVI